MRPGRFGADPWPLGLLAPKLIPEAEIAPSQQK